MRSGTDRGQDCSISINSGLNFKKRFPAKKVVEHSLSLSCIRPEEKENMENVPTDIF